MNPSLLTVNIHIGHKTCDLCKAFISHDVRNESYVIKSSPTQILILCISPECRCLLSHDGSKNGNVHTFLSKLLVPVEKRGFRKPAVVDQRVGFFLEGSSGCEFASENDTAVRFNNAGSLLRRTCKGISERENGKGFKNEHVCECKFMKKQVLKEHEF